MYETYSTVIGTVITQPRRRSTQGGEEVISFRMASTVRYRSPGSDTWQDGSTLYLTVSCWRRLVVGVGAAIGMGSPVIVHGQMSSSQYTAKDGTARSDLEMRAIAIGPDLARCICQIQKAAKVGPTADEEAAVAEQSTADGPGGLGPEPDPTEPEAEPAEVAEIDGLEPAPA
ncbi:single-stranded DNA-binding protein [Tomitella biformata]|uniref:single-stranded DNA-binding protein n=1 Tax=Tomitella biformata TaxID=630403 RepID=UPI000465F49F|nr:single-stranded DNA-binding protein [Tomitella biformata]